MKFKLKKNKQMQLVQMENGSREKNRIKNHVFMYYNDFILYISNVFVKTYNENLKKIIVVHNRT